MTMRAAHVLRAAAAARAPLLSDSPRGLAAAQAPRGAPPPPGADSAAEDEPPRPHEPPPAHVAPAPLGLEYDRSTAEAAGLFDPPEPRRRRPSTESLGRPVDLECGGGDPEGVDLGRLYGDAAPEARLGAARPGAEDGGGGGRATGAEELEGAEFDAEEGALGDVLLGFEEEAAAAEAEAEAERAAAEAEAERAEGEGAARGMHAGEGVRRREDVRG